MALDEQKFIHEAGSLPALFAVHEAILFTEVVRIIEHEPLLLDEHFVSEWKTVAGGQSE
jgi:hypothetical protein